MSEFSEHNGISVDLDDLIEFYESQMTRKKAQQIIETWKEKWNMGWLDQFISPSSLKLDGNYTVDELRAFVWCMENNVDILKFEDIE